MSFIQPCFPADAPERDLFPLSYEMRNAAETLASQVEAGLYAALPADTRCDLRGLAVEMSACSERAAELEMLLTPAPARRSWFCQAFRRAVRRFVFG